MAVGFIPTAAIIGFMKDVEGVTDREEIARAIRMIHAIDEEYLASLKTQT